MPVSTTIDRFTYKPGAAMAAEAIVFQYLEPADIVVMAIDATSGERTPLALDMDYAIAGDGPSRTGTVRALAVWPADDLFEVRRRTALKQEANVLPHQPVPASEVTRTLDRAILVAQEGAADLDDIGARALLVPAGEPGLVLPSLVLRAGRTRVLGSTPTGVLELLDGSDFTGSPGGNVSDVGTFNAAKGLDLAVAQPGTTTIRLSDRGKATFERWIGYAVLSVALLAAAVQDENRWWFSDAGGTRWILAEKKVTLDHVGAIATTLNGAGLPVTTTDNTAVINSATRFARDYGRTAHVPIGAWTYSGRIEVDSTRLTGDGYGSVLVATQKANGTIRLSGKGASVDGVRRKFVGAAGRGSGTADSHGFSTLPGTTGFAITNCYGEGGTDAAILMYASSEGLVAHNRMSGFEADGIHVTNAAGGGLISTNILVGWNIVRDCGDDHYPVVSYTQDGGICSNIVYAFNQSFGGLARAYACIGGTDIQYIHNQADGAALAGFLIDSDMFNNGTQANRNIKWLGGNLFNCGSTGAFSYGAIHVSCRAGYDDVSVLIDGITVSGSRNWGMKIDGNGGSVRGLRLVNSIIENTAGDGINARAFTNLSIDKSTIRYVGGNAWGIYLENGAGNLRVADNHFEAINQAGPSYHSTIAFAGGANAYSRIEVSGNHDADWAAGTQKTAHFLSTALDGMIVERNTPNLGLDFGPAYNQKQRTKGAAVADSTAVATNAAAVPTNAEFNALVAQHNALKNSYNGLLVTLRNAGLIAS